MSLYPIVLIGADYADWICTFRAGLKAINSNGLEVCLR